VQRGKDCNLVLKNKSPESRVKDSGHLCQKPATLPDKSGLWLSKQHALSQKIIRRMEQHPVSV
jgi:hypothetical protein